MNGLDKTAQEQKVPGLGVMSCWSCKGPVSENNTFCDTCGAVQPPGQYDHFTRFGLKPSFDINVDWLDQKYFDFQRNLHPDQFATCSVQEKTLSQQQATSINDAYETLKKPLSRADYMVDLLGGTFLPEGRNVINDQELLLESMELREALEECGTLEQVKVLSTRVQHEIQSCIENLSKLFGDNDIEGACRVKTRLKYLEKLTEEIRMHQTKLV